MIEFSPTNQRFFVDINGPTGPNTFGKDIFLFVLDTTKDIILSQGSDLDDNTVKENCFGETAQSSSWTRSTCAEHIFRNNNTINYW